MRWQQLFSDLQAQFEEEEAAAERGEAASRARAEIGSVTLSQRLGGALGLPVSLRCRGVGHVAGVLVDVGVDWVLLEDERGRSSLMAAGAVRSVTGLARLTATEDKGVVRGRLDLRRALRGLARDRSTVQVVLDDGTLLTGTLDRVGADHIELAEHPVDLPRRAAAVQGVSAVAIAAIAAVRTTAAALD